MRRSTPRARAAPDRAALARHPRARRGVVDRYVLLYTRSHAVGLVSGRVVAGARRGDRRAVLDLRARTSCGRRASIARWRSSSRRTSRAIGAAIVLALFFVDSPLTLAAATSIAWAGLPRSRGASSGRARRRSRSSARSINSSSAMAKADDGVKIAERLAALWKRTRRHRRRGSRAGATRSTSTPELAAWLVAHPQPFAVVELATMRLGEMRAPLEALGKDDPAGLIVPLVDHDELVALVEAQYSQGAARCRARARRRIGASGGARVHVRRARPQGGARARDRARGRGRGCAAAAGVVEPRCAARPLGGRGGVSNRRAYHGCGLVGDRARRRPARVARHRGAGARRRGRARDRGVDRRVRRGDDARRDADHARRARRDDAREQRRRDARWRAGVRVPRDPRREDDDDRVGVRGPPGAFIVGPIATIDTSLADGSLRGVRPKATALGGDPPERADVATRGPSPLPVDSVLVVVSSGGARLRRSRLARPPARQRAGRAAGSPTVLVELALRAGTPTEDLLAVVVRAR